MKAGPVEDDLDPVLKHAIERAVQPYEDRMSPHALDECRRTLALILRTHPDAIRLLERLTRSESGVVERRSPAELTEAARRLVAGKR